MKKATLITVLFLLAFFLQAQHQQTEIPGEEPRSQAQEWITNGEPMVSVRAKLNTLKARVDSMSHRTPTGTWIANGEAFGSIRIKLNALKIVFDSLITAANNGGGGGVAWGFISGSITSQIDLANALAAKAATSHTHTGVYEPANTNLQTHLTRTDNPHSTTKAQVGLGSVENTAISTWSGTSNITTLGTITTGSIPETLITYTDNTTGNASTTKHGMLPKLSGNATEYLTGNGTWAGSGGAGTWGSINGTLANQTDLATALAGKAATGHTHTGVYEPANSNLQAHLTRTDNPHSVTKTQIGLGAVENTAISSWSGTTNITTLGTISTGSIPETKITFTDLVTGNATVSNHGYLPKLSGSASQMLKGDGTWGTGSSAWGAVTGTLANQTDLVAELAAKSNTTHTHTGVYESANTNIQTHIGRTDNPHSTTKAQVGLSAVENTAISTWAGTSNITTLGTIATGSIPESKLTYTDITTGNASTVKHGLLPKLDGNAAHFLTGIGTWETASGGGGSQWVASYSGIKYTGGDAGVLSNKKIILDNDNGGDGFTYIRRDASNDSGLGVALDFGSDGGNFNFHNGDEGNAGMLIRYDGNDTRVGINKQPTLGIALDINGRVQANEKYRLRNIPGYLYGDLQFNEDNPDQIEYRVNDAHRVWSFDNTTEITRIHDGIMEISSDGVHPKVRINGTLEADSIATHQMAKIAGGDSVFVKDPATGLMALAPRSSGSTPHVPGYIEAEGDYTVLLEDHLVNWTGPDLSTHNIILLPDPAECQGQEFVIVRSYQGADHPLGIQANTASCIFIGSGGGAPDHGSSNEPLWFDEAWTWSDRNGNTGENPEGPGSMTFISMGNSGYVLTNALIQPER